jgi:hypothetical protein
MKRMVYLADCGSGIRKIGASDDPAARIISISRVRGLSLILERTWRRPMDAINIEVMAQWYLRVAGLEVGGAFGREFFMVDAVTAIAAVERAIKADAALDWTDLPKHGSIAQSMIAVRLRRGMPMFTEAQLGRRIAAFKNTRLKDDAEQQCA